jgi:hypothetical protein
MARLRGKEKTIPDKNVVRDGPMQIHLYSLIFPPKAEKSPGISFALINDLKGRVNQK